MAVAFHLAEDRGADRPGAPENRERPVTRVLLVVGQLTLGGAEVQLVRLARRLGPLGVHAEVATFHPGDDNDLEGELRDAGILVHRVKRTTKVGLEAILDLARILRQGRHHVVHSFLWPANWRARLAGILARTPVVISSPRSVETWLRPYHVLVDRLLSYRTDAIVVNASAIRDFLVKREGLPRPLFHVISNGLDESIFTRFPRRSEARSMLGLGNENPMVLIIGNFQPEKNHEDFLRMAARVRRRIPETRFCMVGDGERREALESLAQKLELGDAVRWEGQQPDVLPYLAASDVFVNVSEREGCCNAILEAMAASRPTVAYAVGGNPELIVHGQTGRVVDFGDVSGLAEEVIRYLENSDLAIRDGARAAERASKCFLATTTAEKTVTLYRRLLAEKGMAR